MARLSLGASMVRRRFIFLTLVTPLTIFIVGAPAFAQGGSTGGSIGKTNKSVSGDRDQGTPSPPSKKRSKPAASPDEKKQGRDGCPNIVGYLEQLGFRHVRQSDAKIDRDGTTTHSSGLAGKWSCSNGRLRIEWPDGRPGAVTVSEDGKRILGPSGRVHMSR